MKLRKKDFLTEQEFSREELAELIELALTIKSDEEEVAKGLEQKTVLLLFLSPRLHSRLSLEVAIQQLGGKSLWIDAFTEKWDLIWEEGVMALGKNSEHIKDLAKILARYGNAMAIRHVPYTGNWRADRQDNLIRCFAKYSPLPVFNLESALLHPTQALADMITIRQHTKNCSEWKAVLAWTYHPEPEPLGEAHSFALITSKLGMDLTIVCPEDFDLEPGILQLAQKNASDNNSRVEVTRDLKKATQGAHVICARSWRSLKFYGSQEEEKERRKNIGNWIIDRKIMDSTDGGFLLHSPPIRRNVTVTEEVLDSPSSLAYDQAENTVLAQKALLLAMVH